jgi:hypothetical protein
VVTTVPTFDVTEDPMTLRSSSQARSRRFAVLCLAVVVALAPSSMALAGGGSSIAANPATPTTTGGVSFTVSTGGGNRQFTSVDVSCNNVAGEEVYATVLTVEVPPKGSATSQTIYPPESSCIANLVKLMQIGKAQVLATVSFEVTP